MCHQFRSGTAAEGLGGWSSSSPRISWSCNGPCKTCSTRRRRPSLPGPSLTGQPGAEEFWKTLVDLEWPAMALPADAGGVGYGWVELAIVLEELGPPRRAGAVRGHRHPVRARCWPRRCWAGATPRSCWRRWPQGAPPALSPSTRGPEPGTPPTFRPQPAATATTWCCRAPKHYVVDGATADEIARRGPTRRRPAGWCWFRARRCNAVEVVPIDPGVRHAHHRPRRRPSAGQPAAGRRRRPPAAVRRALEESVTAVAAVTRGRLPANLRHHQRLRQGAHPVRGAHRLVPGREAQAGRHVPRRRAGPGVWCTTRLSPWPRITPDRTLAASMAKAAAGEAQRRCVQDGLQLAGGIGFHLGARPAPVPAPGQGGRTPIRLGLPPSPPDRPPSPPGRSCLRSRPVSLGAVSEARAPVTP